MAPASHNEDPEALQPLVVDPLLLSEESDDEFAHVQKASHPFFNRKNDRCTRSRLVSCANVLTRKQKVLLAIASCVAAIVVCALLFRPPIPYRPHHRHPNPGGHGKPKSSKPKLEYCTTWAVDEHGVSSAPDHVPNELDSVSPPGGWKKPEGVPIVGLVFFGRRRYVDILDCYLQQNLVSNGGYLDEVRFMVHTEKEEDTEWLREVVDKTEGYTYYDLGECTTGRYGCIWDHATDPDTMYIKMDDDISWIHPDAIPRLVHSRLDHPQPFAVSANLVNSPLTGFLHYHLDAIHPFLPDPDHKPNYTASEAWRPSELPLYEGQPPMELDVMAMKAPYKGHRWLPVGNESALESINNILFTPVGHTEGGGDFNYSISWQSWAVATQQQYSLLKNIEDNTMSKYHFAGGNDFLWNTNFVRYNIVMFAIFGKDVKDNLPIENDDEQGISVTVPRKLGRPFVIDTKAIVNHAHFGPQTAGVVQTDILDRWRAYANDQVCTKQNRKQPMDGRCKHF